MRNSKGQFIKGKSGNPAGRPRKCYEFLEILDAELERKNKGITVKREICRALADAARKGDIRVGLKLLEIYEGRYQFDIRTDILEKFDELENLINKDRGFAPCENDLRN